MIYDLAVVGGGPAGLSAAVQARVRGKSVLIVSGDVRDNALYKAQRVDNYLGLPETGGGALLERFRRHAQALGAQWKSGRVLNILPSGGTFYLGIGSDMTQARALVLATGVVRTRKYPGEEAHLGRGVSYCATCDGMLYRGRAVAVVGKSADAPEEANYLQSIGCRVTYGCRRAWKRRSPLSRLQSWRLRGRRGWKPCGPTAGCCPVRACSFCGPPWRWPTCCPIWR